MWKKIKNNFKYILIGIALTATLAMLIYILVLQYKLKNQQEAYDNSLTEMKHLTRDIIRSQSQYVTKEDLEKFGSNIDLDLIRDDLDSLGATVKGISKILASSTGYNVPNLPSTYTHPNPNPNTTEPTSEGCEDGLDPWCVPRYTIEYLNNAQSLSLYEPFSDVNIPIGDVTFKAWKDKPWDVNILPRNYRITSVLGENREGQHYLYHKFTIQTPNGENTIKIDNAEFVEERPESQWEWWNPKFGIGMSGGVLFPTSDFEEKGVNASAAPSIFFSPFSYGETKIKPTWIFGQIGIGYELIGKTAIFSLSPAAYNLGTATSVINNTYIAPTVAVDTDKNISLSGTISVTF